MCFPSSFLNFILYYFIQIERDKEALENYWSVENKCRKYTAKILCLILWNQTILIAPLLQSLYSILIGNYGTSAWQLPLEIYVPIDTSTLWGWFLMWIIQFKASFWYSAGFTLITSYFIACCLYIGAICDHFDLLCKSFAKNVELNRCEKNPIKYKKWCIQVNRKLKQMVDIHVKIYE